MRTVDFDGLRIEHAFNDFSWILRVRITVFLTWAILIMMKTAQKNMLRVRLLSAEQNNVILENLF